MTDRVDVEEAERAQRRRQELEDKPPTASSEAGNGCAYFGSLDDDDDDDDDEHGSGSVELTSEVMSSVFQSAFRSQDLKHDVVTHRPNNCSGYPCKQRKRPAATTNYAAKLFPVPVVTSSSPTAVTCQPRVSSSLSLIGVGRLLLLLLPTWLLPMTSFCLATALPVDSDASRAPVKVFDGSTNNADVDGPVIDEIVKLKIYKFCQDQFGFELPMQCLDCKAQR